MPDQDRSDPNATISIDSLGPQDEITFDDPVGAHGERSLPPPLPPAISVAPVAAPREPSRTVLYVGVFVLMLSAAIAAGLFVGLRARRDAPLASSSPSAMATTALANGTAATSAALTAAPSSSVMMLPPVDVR